MHNDRKRRCDALIRRYETAKNKHSEITNQITQLQAQHCQISAFLQALREKGF